MPKLPRICEPAHICSHVTDGNELSNYCILFFKMLIHLKNKFKVSVKMSETPP